MGKSTDIEHEFGAYNHIAAIVLVADENGQIVFANNAVKDVLGFAPSEVLGKNWYELTDAGIMNKSEREQIVLEMAKGTYEQDVAKLQERPLRTKDGKLIWSQWSSKRMPDGKLVGIAQDITEKRDLKDSLVQKNEENEILLKEIHHRVKNNLQIISSFLNLQFREHKSDDVIKAIEKSKSRINAMAIAHNTIYKSSEFNRIDFGTYLNELVETMCQNHCTKASIEHDIDHCSPLFELDLAINLGMIATELVSNVLEHAFDENQAGKLVVRLNRKNDTKHELLISDNGKGIGPCTKDNKKLGLELVLALCDQINGEISVKNGVGTSVAISF